MSSETQLTPMMAQYRRIKGELPKDALLLFRLGDFYEMFFEDALVGAQILNVALTKRGLTPMCGIPFHAANGYVSKLLQAGRKVAICEQVEEAKAGQLVKRDVTQILSPGTHFDERMLTAERNNYLAAVYPLSKSIGLAIVDLTTGSFRCTEIQDETALLTELERLRPAEVLLPSQAARWQQQLSTVCKHVNGYEDWVFATETAQFTVRDHFRTVSLDGFGLKEKFAAMGAAGAVLHYLIHHLRRDVTHLTSMSFYQPSDYLTLDVTTLRHLEVLEPLHRDAPRTATLYGALNRTITPMGARCLRDWLTQPLADCTQIQQRQMAVATWVNDGIGLERFRKELGEVRDLERTLSRISIGSGNARDLVVLRQALEKIPALKQVLAEVERRHAQTLHESSRATFFAEADSATKAVHLLQELHDALTELPTVVALLKRAVTDEPPISVRDGGLVRDGYDPALDELRNAGREGRNWVAQLQQQEIDRTGISSLKVRFNSVFGYYLEVTKSNLDKYRRITSANRPSPTGNVLSRRR